jgi:predicted transposase/invertase (TIGR01784 family)
MLAAPPQRTTGLLDPKLDIVFKLLFTREPALLRAMLQAVLRERIASLRVLNPSIPGDFHTGKGIVLDIRVELENRKRVDVEMQMRAGPAFPERLLYYGTRDYAAQLQRGDDYDKLTPTIVVVWLVEPLFQDAGPLHTTFEFRERTSGRLFTDHLALHVLELSKFRWPAGADCLEEHEVLRWARFLVARSDDELSRLATEDPIMQAAKDALVTLSDDPEASRLARERAENIKLYELELAANRLEARRQGLEEGRIEGLEEGRIEGLEEGRIEGLLRSVSRHLIKRFGPLPESAERVLAGASAAELERIDEAVFDAPSLAAVMTLVQPPGPE